MDRLDQHPLFMHGNHANLLAAYGQELRGSGISAMPSLHVALTALLHLMCRDRFGARHWASIASLAYAMLIWIGSIHLGWHYVVDGIVSVFVVILIWRLGGRLVSEPRDGRLQGSGFAQARKPKLA